MKLNYRKATLKDIPKLCALIADVIKKMEKDGIYQWDALYPTKEDVTEDISQHSMYIGETDGEIAVMFVLNKKSDEEYKDAHWQKPEVDYYVLHKLCVNPTFQGKGVAKRTLEYIGQSVKQMGAFAIRLDVFSKNPYAVSLYEGCGFHTVGHADWRMGRFHIMEKYLT